MNQKSFKLNGLLLLVSVIVSFILIEVFWRTMIFSELEIFDGQRRPELYADEYADDNYWKLRLQLKKKELLPIIYSSNEKQSNHITRYIFSDYLHVNAEYLNGSRPVLLYGDSFAGCYSKDCFDHILNNDDTFSEDHYLLNYGVGGYGLDQIYLMLKNSIDKYENPFVVLSFMTLDLDRSILTIREGPKPYFYTIENNELKLNKSPVYSNAEMVFENNKPRITSYFYRRLLYSEHARKSLPNQLISYLKREDYFKDKTKMINEKILIEIINELKRRNLDYVFLIFHPNWIRGTGSLDENIVDWRDIFIKQILDKYEVPYIWSKDMIFQEIKQNNLSVSDFFIKGDGHPTAYQTGILAKEIKKAVLNIENTNRQ